jgi:hypothetical protein
LASPNIFRVREKQFFLKQFKKAYATGQSSLAA